MVRVVGRAEMRACGVHVFFGGASYASDTPTHAPPHSPSPPFVLGRLLCVLCVLFELQAPYDFKRYCEKRCYKRFQELVGPLKEAYNQRGKDSVRVLDQFQVHEQFCAPILHAVLDACGPQNGTLAVKIARE